LAILQEKSVTHRLSFTWLPLPLLALALTTGCARPQPQGGAPPPPEVDVSLPVTREVTDYEDFPGRTEAISSVDVRARVTGYLDKVCFREGADVKQGDVLLEIDPRPYEAELARTAANLIQAEAHMNRLNADHQRASELLTKRAIGREEYDKINGDRLEAVAAVGVARAGSDLAQLNLSFTKVKSPISGRISRRYIDPGNLVKADDSVLTSIVSLDPMYAYFDVDERATLRLAQLIRAGKLNLSPEAKLPVFMGMANDEAYTQRGTIDFADNRVDADTGTWRLRGLFANPHNGLSSGLYVRVRLPIGDPFPALLIAEKALGADQGQRFVYVVDANDQVEYRRIKVGRLYDGQRVVTDGLKPGEKVVVSGLQRVRPGITVTPKVVTTPGGPTQVSVAAQKR
jgi:multidrug efflux system membrane fusion protein